jgi:hypothetical protein
MRSERRLRGYARTASAGIVVWEPTDSLQKSRRRTTALAVSLSVLALAWLAGLGKGGSVEGVVILEIFTLVPLAVVVARLRSLRRKIREVDSVGREELERESLAMPGADEQLLHIGRLVAMLRRGGARDAGADALAVAEKATDARRRLLRRRDELSRLMKTTSSAEALGTLKVEMRGCQANLGQAESAVDELAATIAKLVDAAETDADRPQLAEVRDATERAAAFAAALRGLSTPPTGAPLPSSPSPGRSTHAH